MLDMAIETPLLAGTLKSPLSVVIAWPSKSQHPLFIKQFSTDIFPSPPQSYQETYIIWSLNVDAAFGFYLSLNAVGSHGFVRLGEYGWWRRSAFMPWLETTLVRSGSFTDGTQYHCIGMKVLKTQNYSGYIYFFNACGTNVHDEHEFSTT